MTWMGEHGGNLRWPHGMGRRTWWQFGGTKEHGLGHMVAWMSGVVLPGIEFIFQNNTDSS